MEQGLCTDKLEPHLQSHHYDTKNSKWPVSVPGKATQKVKEATTAPEIGKVRPPPVQKYFAIHFTSQRFSCVNTLLFCAFLISISGGTIL